ncbi:acyl-CoA dehydratase activase [Methanolobus vulcani]|uniref:CoA activase n=1 Tax=Methanolobus vulcani TaxID=38026 RepID=A0A7Z8KSG3_9EURY|nr:acyl-CoA dehydratase activase [Methanolobus vulcani]TQD27649.1 CoA activase [Methanolobus vulcani]
MTSPTPNNGRNTRDSVELDKMQDSDPEYSLGIDIGYSSVKIALIDEDNDVVHTDYVLHKGKIKEKLNQIIIELSEKYDTGPIVTCAVTGSESKFLSNYGDVIHINDVSALIEGSILTNENICSIIEIGGETARYITGFGKNTKSNLEISMNSNCAAGTGSFLEEQVSRLGLDIEDYSFYAAQSKSVPRIAGRCSVFAKTDVIHHQQEGVPVEDILQGLAYAVVRNYKGAVIKRLPLEKPLILTGGVAFNRAIANALKDILKLDDDELFISEKCGNIAAIGAAVIAKEKDLRIDISKILNILKDMRISSTSKVQTVNLPALGQFGLGDSGNKHICKIPDSCNDMTNCYLGVDIGSTSTNLVLIDEMNDIIAYRYLKTLGNPKKAVVEGLKELREEYGDRVNIIGAGTTGSGRYMIAKLIGADLIKDEITAQAKAAVSIDSSVDTVFEIGGQDSKYISLNDGIVTDFQMNKICAAGTGSFIEEQTNKFDINIDEFGEIALKSNKPVYLGERCTVFIETSIAAHLASGTRIEDIASGLCYSIAKNYLNRVVGQKKIGNRIFLQGGIAHNQGVVNAFQVLTGKDIVVPPFFSVTGAYGVAVLTKEEIGSAKTTFKGFNIEENSLQVINPEKPNVECKEKSEFNEMVNKLMFEDYDGSIDQSKKTIGLPRALFTYGMYPMFSAFFRELGYNVVLSDPTSEETIRLGQEYSLDEMCYPVKLINGHVAELVNKKVDYIFFPDLYTVVHPGSHTRLDFGCPYMQLAFKIVNRAMELDKKGIEMLSPTIGFSLGEEFMRNSFMALSNQLGKSPDDTISALQKGMQGFHDFEKRMEQMGKEIVKGLKPDEKAFILISKSYGVADPVLNLSIPEKLKEMGYRALPFYNLPEGDVANEHPNMYWPFGQHILEAAQVVRSHPNLYAILLTHHGCGPDTVFSHYFREIMADKPYLNIEVDEHSSGVGVTTRLEAFVNSLQNIPTETAEDMDTYLSQLSHTDARIKTSLYGTPKNAQFYLPDLYPYSQLICELLKTYGIDAKTLPKTNEKSIDGGRKYTVTNEYFSMAALIGDVLAIPGIRDRDEYQKFLLVPQSEGAEVDGQYNRFLRTVLDEEGIKDVSIIAPFMEDLLNKDDVFLQNVFLILIAGDIIRNTPYVSRDSYMKTVLDKMKSGQLSIEVLKSVLKVASDECRSRNFEKNIFAIGEPMILYNDFLHNHIFGEIESRGYRVVCAPFSEYMWQLWKDFADQANEENRPVLQAKLDVFKGFISDISNSISGCSPFEKDLDDLIVRADNTMGYYAGAFGRYRGSKILGELEGMDGVITVTSMYENTGILLNTLHKGFENENNKPVLNLTFDGNKNENDESRVESFLYYL